MNAVASAVLRLSRALEAAGLDYVIGGAVALSYWAVPRATADVDITIDVDVARLPAHRAKLDGPYVERWIADLFSADDARVARYRAIAGAR